MTLDFSNQRATRPPNLFESSSEQPSRNPPAPPINLNNVPLKRSPNDVRLRPASPETITGMLASFASISSPSDSEASRSLASPVGPTAATESEGPSPQYQDNRRHYIDRHADSSTESPVDFQSPTTEEQVPVEPEIEGGAEAPIVRVARDRSAFARYKSKRKVAQRQDSSSGLRTAYSPTTPASPPTQDVLSPLRPRSPSGPPSSWRPPKHLNQTINGGQNSPSQNGPTRGRGSFSITERFRSRSKLSSGATTPTDASYSGRQPNKFVSQSMPGSYTHSPSRSYAHIDTSLSNSNVTSPPPDTPSPQLILQGVKIPAIKPTEDELPPSRGSIIPDRHSSLRYSEDQPREKRRTLFSRRIKPRSREPLGNVGIDEVVAKQTEKENRDMDGANDERSPGLLEEEDTDVTRRIKQLKAAKEERQKTEAAHELSEAMAATLPTFDPSLPSQMTTTPPPLTNGFAMDGTIDNVHVGHDTVEERSTKRESFLVSPTTPDALNGLFPPNDEEPPPLPSPNPAFQNQSESRPQSQGRVSARPSSRRNKRWSTPEGDAFFPKRDPSIKSIKRGIGSSQKANQAFIRSQRTSLDEIEDSVRSFLSSPRLSQTIPSLERHRRISFSEVGDPDGFVVVCCVGMGLTRFITAFYEELARTLKLRLITLDRPGVGDSGAYGNSNYGPLQWPDDLQLLCNHLSISSFSLLAHSAGAIYALATALKMPNHVKGKIHLLAPWIPPSQMVVDRSQSTSNTPGSRLPRSQRFLRLVPTPFLKLTNSSLLGGNASPKAPSKPSRKSGEVYSASVANSGRPSMSQRAFSPSASMPTISAAPERPSTPHLEDMVSVPSDHGITAAVLSAGAIATPRRTQPGTPRTSTPTAEEQATSKRRAYDAALIPAVWHLATKNSNPTVDLLVCLERTQRIGFRYADVHEEVVIHHGSRDNRVPLDNIRWLGGVMRNVELRVIEGEGHGLMGNAAVMGQVLVEIGKEREEEAKAERRDKQMGIQRDTGDFASLTEQRMYDAAFVRKTKSQPASRRPTMMARPSGRT